MRRFLVLAFLIFVFSNFGYGAAKLKIQPSEITLPTNGETFSVNIMIENASDIAAYQFDLAFDKYTLKIESDSDVIISSILESTSRTSDSLGPIVDNSSGVVTAGEYSYGEGSGANISSSQKLVSVTFKVLDQQSGVLKLEGVQLYDTSGNSISCETEDAIFTPAGAPIPTLSNVGKLLLILSIISAFLLLKKRRINV